MKQPSLMGIIVPRVSPIQQVWGKVVPLKTSRTRIGMHGCLTPISPAARWEASAPECCQVHAPSPCPRAGWPLLLLHGEGNFWKGIPFWGALPLPSLCERQLMLSEVQHRREVGKFGKWEVSLLWSHQPSAPSTRIAVHLQAIFQHGTRRFSAGNSLSPWWGGTVPDASDQHQGLGGWDFVEHLRPSSTVRERVKNHLSRRQLTPVCPSTELRMVEIKYRNTGSALITLADCFFFFKAVHTRTKIGNLITVGWRCILKRRGGNPSLPESSHPLLSKHHKSIAERRAACTQITSCYNFSFKF